MIRFRTSDLDQLTENISPVAGSIVAQTVQGSEFEAAVTLSKLPRLGFFSVTCKNLRVTQHSPRDFIGLTIPHKGRFLIRKTNQKLMFSQDTCHLLGDTESFDLSVRDISQLYVVNFFKPQLDAYAKQFGNQKIDFSRYGPNISFNTPAGETFWRYLTFFWKELNRVDSFSVSPLATAEMESTLIALFLLASENPSEETAISRGRITKTYVRRAEEYIAANLTREISAAKVAHAAGVSYPTLTRAFQRHRGISPMRFAKQLRLEGAQKALLSAESNHTTVTAIAMKYGFFHLSQFAFDYRKTFGELPSDTLKR